MISSISLEVRGQNVRLSFPKSVSVAVGRCITVYFLMVIENMTHYSITFVQYREVHSTTAWSHFLARKLRTFCLLTSREIDELTRGLFLWFRRCQEIVENITNSLGYPSLQNGQGQRKKSVSWDHSCNTVII